ncbi:MAG TPA: HAD family hydrolase [Ktedonobacterales bacterium]|nr:HAD family hydrolase [Ktedonobacterales bacterium]
MPVRQARSDDHSDVWLRPGLERATALGGALLDTALFDVDGVLIETQRSYRLAVIHGSERLVRAAGLEPPDPMVSQEDVAALKLAGGFNSDWDLTRLFAALWTARLREWRGAPEAEAPVTHWAAQAAEAAREGRGGVAWLLAALPATAIPSEAEARWAHDEFYWGAALARELFGREPVYGPEAAGFVHNEELLLDETLLPALAQQRIAKLGLITGRVGPEVDWAVRALAERCGLEENDGWRWHESAHGRSPFGSIVPATIYAKPNPRALAHALEALEARAAVYVGDTADDLDLVLRYRRELAAQETGSAVRPPVLAAMVAMGAAAEAYRARGADLILARVTQLPAALARIP